MVDFKLFLKGIAMGAANVIPGVSGGTVAFITGIYERLINALKSFDFSTLSLLLKGKWSEFVKATDLKFLSVLLAGVAVSIISLAKIMELAFENYETLTLSLFFGLIMASIIAVSKQISEVNVSVILCFLIGAVLAASIAFLPPAQPNDSFFYVFLCGIVAVCSMILPGLSGSYILLLMGNYVLVLRAISQFEFSILVPLMIGCAAGLVIFARLLSYLFKKFKNQTIAVLAGFVAGSLIIIWPWKETIMGTFDGKEKAVGYVWKLPALNTQLPLALLLIAVGFLLVWRLERKTN